MPDRVFVSHASHDRAIVESQIIPALRDVGIGIWYSQTDLQSPDIFQQRIREALEGCNWFLVVLSPRSVDSRWVQAEVSLAMERMPNRIVPVIVDPCEPVKCHLQLNLYQHIDLTTSSSEGFRRLQGAFGSTITSSNSTVMAAAADSKKALLAQLREIRSTPASPQMGFLFQSLAHSDEQVRNCAKESLQTIGWNTAAQAVEELAFGGQSAELNQVLNGIVALESHPEVVKFLDRLSNQLTGELRNRAILLLERKSLSLQSERIARILKENKSPLVIQKALGQGLTSATFLAKHRFSDSEVVIRSLRPEYALQPDIRHAFLELMKRASRYVHENLVRVRDVGQFASDNFYFQVRDFIPGATLQNVMDQGQSFAPRQILEIAREIAKGLRPIHRAGECHQSIKPSNVFLTSDNQIILGDLGLPIASLGMDMRRMSYDFRYAAPEHFQSQAELTPTSDYYSLGCLVFQLIHGVPPYAAETPYDLIRAHLTAVDWKPRDRQNPLGTLGDDLLAQLLSHDPKARPSESELFRQLDGIEGWLSGNSITKSKTGPTSQPPNWQKFAPQHSIVSLQDQGGASNPLSGLEEDSVQTLFPSMMLPRTDSTPTSSDPSTEGPSETKPQNSPTAINLQQPSNDNSQPPPDASKRQMAELLDRLVALALLSSEDRSRYEKHLNETDSLDLLVDLLVEKHTLTKYQADVICERRPGSLMIGDYIIVDKLGAGGSGVVYKAFDPRMHRHVAIKMLLDSGQQSEDKIERFRREAITAARMNHPNIITTYAAGEHEGFPYIVMEHIQGRDLGSLVKKGDKLPIPEAVNYVLQAAVGLGYAHSRNIIHRDVKPSNLLLAAGDDSNVSRGGYARVKILDMGLARLIHPQIEVPSKLHGSDLSATGMLMGTVDYMAPEQAMDTKRADQRSDIYSLGCTLYFLLTKRPVYSGNNLLERISAHLKAEIPSLKAAVPEVSEELDAVFQKMIAKKPKDRYQSMSEVVEALQPLDRQLSGSNPSQSSWQRGANPDSNLSSMPGDSYGARSGSQDADSTIVSGLGPVTERSESSLGRTAELEKPSSTSKLEPPAEMPLQQKLVVVLLLGLMAGTMGAIYYKYSTQEPKIIESDPVIVEKEVQLPPPLPAILLPDYCQPAEGLGEEDLVEVTTAGEVRRCYPVIEMDIGQLPNLPIVDQGPNGPAVAAKPGEKTIRDFLKGEVWLRFRLIPANDALNTRAFYMMENKVWSDLFRVFAESQSHKLAKDNLWTQNPPGTLPVYHIDLEEAYWFARWMGGRLPSARQWDIATGFYIPEEERPQSQPYRLPTDGEPLKVAVNGTAMEVDAETDDISPYGIRHMAGNGLEFTRTIFGGLRELNSAFSSSETRPMVYLCGESYDSDTPLTYEKMQDRLEHVPTLGSKPDSTVSFRVVLEVSAK